MNKICTKCKKEKLISFFSPRKARDGYSSECKVCHNEIVRLSAKRRALNDPEYMPMRINKLREWQKRNPERYRIAHNKRIRAWQKRNPILHRLYNVKSKKKAIKTLANSYVNDCLVKHSHLKIDDIPLSLTLAKREYLRLRREVIYYEKY